MKIIPVASQHAMQQPQGGTTDSRAKAIKAFEAAAAPAPTQDTTQEYPVRNANQVAPEDLSAIKATSQAPETTDNTIVSEGSEVTEPEKPKEDPALSRQFAQLARQERQLRQQQADLKAQKAALDAERASMKPPEPQDLSNYYAKDRIKNDPLSVLEDAGLSYDDLTQAIINRQPTDPRVMNTINQLQEEIKALRQANEEVVKSQNENKTQAYQAAVKQIEIDVKNLIRQDPAFETISATNSGKDVVDLITQTYEKDGILLSVEEAAQEVEEYLVEEAMKLTRIGKIKRQLEKSNASTNQAQKTASTPQTQPQMKTLTNATASTRKLSARERALLAFKGERIG